VLVGRGLGAAEVGEGIEVVADHAPEGVEAGVQVVDPVAPGLRLAQEDGAAAEEGLAVAGVVLGDEGQELEGDPRFAAGVAQRRDEGLGGIDVHRAFQRGSREWCTAGRPE